MEENTKLLQDLNPLGSPYTKGIWLGGIVDLDLLFLFPQEYARIIGGIGRKASFLKVNNGGERVRKRLGFIGEEGALL